MLLVSGLHRLSAPALGLGASCHFLIALWCTQHRPSGASHGLCCLTTCMPYMYASCEWYKQPTADTPVSESILIQLVVTIVSVEDPLQNAPYLLMIEHANAVRRPVGVQMQ